VPAPREDAVKLGKHLNLLRELWERGLRKELEELLDVLVPRVELQSVDVGGETRTLAPVIHIHDPDELAAISRKDNLGKVALYH
jgi:hypothetical protein